MSTCTWTIDPDCCAELWAATPEDMQNRATRFATDVLWASTGRQFGTCPMTVRPCLKGGQWGFAWYNQGYGGFTGWQPFIYNGQWYNGPCGCSSGCILHPFTSATLLGPVAGIAAVVINGVTLTPTAYRVDEQQFLIRQDGDHWPVIQNLNHVDGDVDTWSVTYFHGTPVPGALLAAAGTLACEYIKACNGDSSCRLDGRVVSIVRTGVEMQMTPLDDLLKLGYTGLQEVDMLIRSYNPTGLTHRLRLYSPDVDTQTITTWSSP
jgi:hypothetical protein